MAVGSCSNGDAEAKGEAGKLHSVRTDKMRANPHTLLHSCSGCIATREYTNWNANNDQL
jgi:hypothetical protein